MPNDKSGHAVSTAHVLHIVSGPFPDIVSTVRARLLPSPGEQWSWEPDDHGVPRKDLSSGPRDHSTHVKGPQRQQPPQRRARGKEPQVACGGHCPNSAFGSCMTPPQSYKRGFREITPGKMVACRMPSVNVRFPHISLTLQMEIISSTPSSQGGFKAQMREGCGGAPGITQSFSKHFLNTCQVQLPELCSGVLVNKKHSLP